jgi:hypothetical protein
MPAAAAPAASGHATAEPIILMKSRRRITAPKTQEHADTGSLHQKFAAGETGFEVSYGSNPKPADS